MKPLKGISGRANVNPYAVSCIIPKRRSTQVGSVNVADIFARPSLAQSHGGYRTPNVKPFPMVTPTLSDSGNVPALPITDYVLQSRLAYVTCVQRVLFKHNTTHVLTYVRSLCTIIMWEAKKNITRKGYKTKK